jgi:hypothetical protein
VVVGAQHVEHGALHAAVRVRLEGNAAGVLEPVGGLDEPDGGGADEIVHIHRLGELSSHALRHRACGAEAVEDAPLTNSDARLDAHI